MRARTMRHALLVPALAALLAPACRTEPAREAPAPAVDDTPTSPPPVTVTRGEFTVPADKLDVWNAVGQIVVRTDGVEYLGRAQMLDLYSLRYRGVEFLVLTKAMTAAETGNRTLTRVTATTAAGKRIDHDATAELLGMLQRELPTEVERVRNQQAAAKKKSGKRGKP